MSLFNKVLASIGIGASKVNTKLYKDQYQAGEEVKGVIEIRGGNVEQTIDEIYLVLQTTYVKESDDKKYTQTGIIGKCRVLEKFTINPNDTKEVPFSITIPFDTPITMGRTKVWIHTSLDIKNAIDPTDKDFITVSPLPTVSSVLSAVQNLGFRLREVECEEAPRHLRGKSPFVQEFEFVPSSGEFRGKLDELELIFLPQSKDTVEIFMQVDRKARGLGSLLAEALEMDESNVRFTVNSSDLPNITTKISEIIRRYS